MSSGKKGGVWDGQRETLDDLAQAVHYNRWIYRLMAPHLGKRILEVGCGTGNITGFLADHGKVLAVDVHPGYLASAKKKCGRRGGLSFKRLDLGRGLPALKGFKPDTIVCVNVLEHIEDDRKFLGECRKVLAPGGRLVLFVPALQFLFGSMDESYGHFRRYYRDGLWKKLEGAGFSVEQGRYLNLLGTLGWWLNGKVLKRKIIPKGQMLLYDQVVRVLGPIEEWFPRPLGLSLFVVAVKNP